MSPRRSTRARPVVLAVAALAWMTACERSAPEHRTDSLPIVAAPVANPASPVRDDHGWNAAAGPALLVESGSAGEALVLLPFADDSASEDSLAIAADRDVAVELIGRGGTRLTAHLDEIPDVVDSRCRRWPLRDVAAPGGGAWSVGFVGARVTPVPLDSVETLSSRDSSTLAAEASRLASAVTAATGPSFHGLRFTAHDIRRFEAAAGVQALVAHVLRRVNQEANPQEEQTLVIAERDSGVTSGPYRLVYADRAYGREEEVSTPEVLAAVRFGSSPQPTLVLAREGDAGVTYSLIERTGAGRWRVRWTSALTRCG